MSVLQLASNVVKIATVSIAIIDTTRNTSKFTSNTITQSEKPSKRNSLGSIRDVHVENLDALKSTVNATKPVCSAEIFVSVFSVKTTNHSVIKKLFLTSRETPPQIPIKPPPYVTLHQFRPHHPHSRQSTPQPNTRRLKPAKHPGLMDLAYCWGIVQNSKFGFIFIGNWEANRRADNSPKRLTPYVKVGDNDGKIWTHGWGEHEIRRIRRRIRQFRNDRTGRCTVPSLLPKSQKPRKHLNLTRFLVIHLFVFYLPFSDPLIITQHFNIYTQINSTL